MQNAETWAAAAIERAERAERWVAALTLLLGLVASLLCVAHGAPLALALPGLALTCAALPSNASAVCGAAARLASDRATKTALSARFAGLRAAALTAAAAQAGFRALRIAACASWGASHAIICVMVRAASQVLVRASACGIAAVDAVDGALGLLVPCVGSVMAFAASAARALKTATMRLKRACAAAGRVGLPFLALLLAAAAGFQLAHLQPPSAPCPSSKSHAARAVQRQPAARPPWRHLRASLLSCCPQPVPTCRRSGRCDAHCGV
jgi:hypothetical protein